MNLGSIAVSARLEYDTVLGRALGRILGRPVQRVDSSHISETGFSVSETLEKVTVVFEVPGYAREELLLEATSQFVRVKSPKTLADRRRVALERFVQMPEPVEPERVAATLQDGLLTVDLPKSAWVRGKARRVPIEAGPSVSSANEEQPDQHA
ncbi:Hsp20/alpha crystallin family protein [Hansschlegelia sp. KR7-227]|uniref:Hsp20/alpha crystallin family protein n=1 Tax=Hansschlegelia sp. KR7-227 TaxID=3400914 RepID=UPI003C01CB95